MFDVNRSRANAAQRYPIRHPNNANLRLHYDQTFAGLPLTITAGLFIREYLSDLKYTIELALAEYPEAVGIQG